MHRFITPQRTNINIIVNRNFQSAVQKKSSLLNKMSTIARLYISRKYILSSSADEKRLSSSRNSTALPLHSLSNVNFHTHATHRFTQHLTRSVPTSLHSIPHILPFTGFGWEHAFYTHPLLLADSSASLALTAT